MLKTVDAIIDAFGGTGAVAEKLGVGAPAVSNWRAAGVIPSQYFLVFSGWAASRKLKLDTSIFGFKDLETAG